MVAKNGEAQRWLDRQASVSNDSRQENIDMKSLSKAVSEFTIFKFGKHDIRVVTKNGDPWFVAKDVCDAIGLTNSRVSLQALDDDEKGVSSTYTPGGVQDMAVVSESGMFTLVLRCRDAVNFGSIPHQFRKWVTGEVLPAIRKTGSYQKKTSKENHLLTQLELICTTWHAARANIEQWDPLMAEQLDSSMRLFDIYTSTVKSININMEKRKRKGRALRIN